MESSHGDVQRRAPPPVHSQIGHGPHDANRTNAAIGGLDQSANHIVTIYAKLNDGGYSGETRAVWWPPSPGNVSASVSAGSSSGVANVALSWDAVSGASKYRYRTQQGSDTWGDWTETTATSAAIADLERGSSYAFQVEAYVPLYPGGRSEWSALPGAASASIPAESG